MKKLLLSMFIVLGFVFVMPVVIPELQSTYTVQAASVKINKKKITLNVKENYTLKIKGTSKKVKWSTSNKKIATVNSKGKVVAKKKGSVTITGKVGSKKYQCKVKVENPKLNKTSLLMYVNEGYTLKVTGTSQSKKWSSSNAKVVSVDNGILKALKNGTATISVKIGKTTYKCSVTVSTYEKYISISYVPLKYSVIALVTNTSSIPLSVAPTMVFYDESGNMQSTTSDFNFCLEPKATATLEFLSYNTSTYESQTYASYKLNMGDIDRAYYTKYGVNKINVVANQTDGALIAEVTNNTGENLDSILISAIFYDAEGNAIGYYETYADCKSANSSDYIKLYYPHDDDYNDIVPASYKIFVNHAYSYYN